MDQTRSWKDTAGTAWTQLTVFAASLSALLRSALDEYRYRDQRPRTRPWLPFALSYLRRIDLSSALSHLRQIDLSDRWAEVRAHPTPLLLAQSLSHLNAMTQSPDVFHSVLVALGDIAIGRQVAPLVSFDLQSRLATEIRHTWRKSDLVSLSRFILADLHLSGTTTIPRQVRNRFTRNDKSVKSESIVFALVELQRTYYVDHATISRYLPDIPIQPRGLWYLLPHVHDYETAVVLAQRYWDHLDPLSIDQVMNLDRELCQLLPLLSPPWNVISEKVDRRSGGRAGLLQLLVISLDYLDMDSVTQTCALIFKVLDGEEHACIVSAFGPDNPRIADGAWAVLSPYNPAVPPADHIRLEMALPLDQFMPRRWAKGVRPPVLNEQCDVEACLVRTVVRLLSPSQYFWDFKRLTSKGEVVSTLELCVRCLHTQLCHRRSVLDELNKLTIITLILERVVLFRVCALYTSIWNDVTKLTAERDVIGILTAIARRLAALLASGATDTDATGAKLFCLLSFSQTTDYAGEEVTWDLGSYLRDFAGRLPQQDPGTRISLRRLISVFRTLRPLCAPHDNLRAAWERIGLAADDDYQESFWDTDDFELGPLLDSESHIASLDVASSHEEITASDAASSHEDTTPPVATKEWTALHWLDAAMR